MFVALFGQDEDAKELAADGLIGGAFVLVGHASGAKARAGTFGTLLIGQAEGPVLVDVCNLDALTGFEVLFD